MQLVANYRFPFDSRMVDAEKEFEATEAEADILVKLGHARYITRNLETGSEKMKGSRQHGPRIITKGA